MKLLIKAQSEAGVELTASQRNFTRKELHNFQKRYNTDILEEKQQVIGSWMGQPKGLLQVLVIVWKIVLLPIVVCP